MKFLRNFVLLASFIGLIVSSYYALFDVSTALASSVLSSLLVGYVWGEKVARHSFYPRRIPKGSRKNTVLVVGLGRSGKSCLIEVMTDKLGKKKPKLTNKFSIHSCSWVDENKRPAYFHFTDYRGQDFSQFISNFVKQQFEPKTLLRYGDINSLVIVVDVFDYNENVGDRVMQEQVDYPRIQMHLGQWNSTALDAIFGLLTEPQLNYVCLFINKIDKLRGGDDLVVRQRVKNYFAPLIEDLGKRVRNGIQLDILIGSALGGDGVLGKNGSLLDTEGTLMHQLYRHGVPLRKGDKDEG